MDWPFCFICLCLDRAFASTFILSGMCLPITVIWSVFNHSNTSSIYRMRDIDRVPPCLLWIMAVVLFDAIRTDDPRNWSRKCCKIYISPTVLEHDMFCFVSLLWCLDRSEFLRIRSDWHPNSSPVLVFAVLVRPLPSQLFVNSPQ